MLFGDEGVAAGTDVEKDVLKGRFEAVMRRQPIVRREERYAAWLQRLCCKKFQILEA
jgi:hypothetical protein